MSRFNDRDAALESLVFALQSEDGLLAAEGEIAFLHARPHQGLGEVVSRLVCEQHYKPDANALESAAWTRVDEASGKFGTVLLLPDRQRDQTLADLARGMNLLVDGGKLVVALHNDWGAKRFEKLLAELAGEVSTLSKHHCRVFWAEKTDALDVELMHEWLEEGKMRLVEPGSFWSRPGLFSWGRADEGSLLLVKYLPERIFGHVGDLGAGWGFLSKNLLAKYHEIRSLYLYEADRLALECAQRNVSAEGRKAKVHFEWADVTAGVGERKLDFVVMNPPFHEGRAADPLLGLKFIAAAANALKREGELWMVANRQLPYERQLRELFEIVTPIVQADGFKVIRAVRGTASLDIS